MGLLKEEYVPVADALLNSLTRDLDLFQSENHLFTSDYLAGMQNKTDELRAKETGDAFLVMQKQTTQDLYALGNDINKPIKLLNLVLKKSNIETSLGSNVLKKIKKRNFEGVLQDLKGLKEVISSQSALLISNGMKADTENVLETAFNTITAKSNEQTNFRQQRKAFTSVNKQLYSEVYQYISDVAKLGKIIFQGEQKASEYTIDNLIALVNVSKKGGTDEISKTPNS
ncbi:hypothetical protein [Chryseobacterium luquanense]|uniref:Toxic anion resistance protein n=1 Tax=Chryseobacterium luquanense TaxID=2983766 RepID=A0ABT3Y1Q9_9FLAO|nr:hypothetical protein [Chryseobacterium luquanense]MCX8532089.1 hypothetical protein [Chryseobacterium luquanense]